jgi:3-deoxy-manno-octulosonate cytidylyltransferase (CMP-KDO synthetase)
MNPITVIPARMASTRLPGKPLAEIAGVPMIVRVWRQAVAADIGPVVVAAAEREIADAVENAGGRAVLTPPDLPSGSDRAFAALKALDPKGAHDIVVNLQGDLPALDPSAIRAVLDALVTTGADIATLAAEIDDPADADNPSVVKPVVVWDAGGRRGHALYFTRARAPWGEGSLYHHIGIYAFARAALARFVALPASPLEKREKLEQLRALEAGMRIAVARVDEVPLSVDTPADMEKARKLLAGM